MACATREENESGDGKKREERREESYHADGDFVGITP
jgi:hypothetical protein